jgi:hypothetical protein
MSTLTTRSLALTFHILTAIFFLLILWRFWIRNLILHQSSHCRHNDVESGRGKRRGWLATFFLGTYHRPRTRDAFPRRGPKRHESALLENGFWEVLGRVAAWYHGIEMERDSRTTTKFEREEREEVSRPKKAHVRGDMFLLKGIMLTINRYHVRGFLGRKLLSFGHPDCSGRLNDWERELEENVQTV